MFSGGAVTRMAIFALGIMPYISSSIIVQLLTGVSDYFKNLKEQGEVGRKKITQITRYGTVLIAMFTRLWCFCWFRKCRKLVIRTRYVF